MKKPFNLQEWLADQSQKVVTRDDCPVEILKWDYNGRYDATKPVLCIIQREGYDLCRSVCADGMLYYSHESCDDLFFVTDEPELTEFEDAFAMIIHSWGVPNESPYNAPDALKEDAAKLLSLARKQIEAERLADDNKTMEESEDERIREWLISYVSNCPNQNFEFYGGVGKDAVLAWLEKQKENPKTAYSIPSNCVSEAKCDIPSDYPIGFPFDSEVMNVMCDAAIGDRDWKSQSDVKFCSDKLLAIVYDGLKEYKPEWGKEDEEKEKEVISKLRHILNEYALRHSGIDVNGDYCEQEFIDIDTFLKALPRRINLEKVQRWSEEDENMFVSVLHFLSTNRINERGKVITWVKSLPERFSLQPKQEWGEEDEDAITTAIRACRYMTENFENSTKQYEDAIERLKSIRPHWKPSEGQMLKNSVEGTVMDFSSNQLRPQVNVLLAPHKYHTGEKVRIIIVKEENK